MQANQLIPNFNYMKVNTSPFEGRLTLPTASLQTWQGPSNVVQCFGMGPAGHSGYGRANKWGRMCVGRQRDGMLAGFGCLHLGGCQSLPNAVT